VFSPKSTSGPDKVQLASDFRLMIPLVSVVLFEIF
jgi:hypothetical protein